jgi:uncharacterized membrane protein
MPENPYAPPRAEVDLPPAEPAVAPDILKKIRNAWIAGLFSAGMTLLFTLLAVFGTHRVAGFGTWQLVDVGLLLALSFGVHRKSRVCATLLLVYFAVSKALVVSETGKVDGVVMALILFYCYVQGVLGTFAYHRSLKR